MSKKVPKPGRYGGRAQKRDSSTSAEVQTHDQKHLNEMRRVLALCHSEDRHGAFRFLEAQYLWYAPTNERPSPSVIASALVEWLDKRAA